jgi:hypothetical protein
MPITVALSYADFNNSDATSYSTPADCSLLANKLYLLFVSTRTAAGSPNEPTVTGLSVTWTKIRTKISAPNNTRLTVFRTLNTTAVGPGALTIDLGGQTQQNMQLHMAVVSGVVTGGTNGADAIVQSADISPSDGSTSATVILSAITSAQNAVVGGMSNTYAVITPGSGFTELSEFGQDNRESQIQYKIGTDNTCDWTFASANDIVGIAVEVKAFIPSGFFGLL